MSDGTGEISQLEVEQLLIGMRAFGEIMAIPTGQLDVILDRMRGGLEDPRGRALIPPGPPD